MYFVFFSKEQKEYYESQGDRPIFARLEDGSIVEYTELCSDEKTSSSFNGFILLGRGDFHHIVGTPKNAIEIKSKLLRNTRNTISSKKFEPFKIHPSLPPEKFRLKSPKNIFKERPFGYNH